VRPATAPTDSGQGDRGGGRACDIRFEEEVERAVVFSPYSVVPGAPLAPDFFVPADPQPPPGVVVAKVSFSNLSIQKSAPKPPLP
jgi:hypothetical protein